VNVIVPLFAAVAFLILGALIVTWREVIPLERENTDLRRKVRQQDATIRAARATVIAWRDRARFYERLMKLERQILDPDEPDEAVERHLSAIGGDPRD
jgi:hypothetical protein